MELKVHECGLWNSPLTDQPKGRIQSLSTTLIRLWPIEAIEDALTRHWHMDVVEDMLMHHRCIDAADDALMGHPPIDDAGMGQKAAQRDP
jgi:hypothetical protein